jgi:hypothetical protein
MTVQYTVSKNVLSSKIDDEIVLLSMDNGLYFTLNPMGSSIWDILTSSPTTYEEIVKLLAEDYEVSLKTCTDDVTSFLNDLVSKNLILKVEE